MPNKLSQFWQELKRRNVVRVVTVYAGAAFVILELVDILAPSLGLPNWTLNLVLILLSLGFVITVIVSWIYDIHPEGGMVITEPAHKVKPEDIPNSSRTWKVASYISFVVIVGLIVLNIIPRANRNRTPEVLDKSIAVIPFESLSEDPEKQYQADGVMDAILLHLSKIEDLRVISRTSVEQYRRTDKTVNQICEELDVAYLLEGSFRRYGDQARLIVQLIQPGREEHIWANNYDRDWKDIFIVESEVAMAIAGELQAVLTPDVKQRIEKVPTTNLTAYDYYQRGREQQRKYSSRIVKSDPSILGNAEHMYRQAIHFDSSFANAYAGLAETFIEKFTLSGSLSISYLDSALNLADKALSIDDQLALAHSVKGSYYLIKGDIAQASREFEIALDLNPNDYQVYINQGSILTWVDHAKAIYNFHKAASLVSGVAQAEVLMQLSLLYMIAGFEEQAEYYAEEALRKGSDSVGYYYNIGWIDSQRGGYVKSLEMADKILSIDPNNAQVLSMKGLNHGFAGQYEESIKAYEKYREAEGLQFAEFNQLHRIGYAYWQLGNKEKANAFFNQMIEYADSIIELGNNPFLISGAYYDLAATYAFLGKKDDAFENLRHYSEFPATALYYWLKESDPMFNDIRDDPEFQQIVQDVGAKYQGEQERVKQWLEENEML